MSDKKRNQFGNVSQETVSGGVGKETILKEETGIRTIPRQKEAIRDRVYAVKSFYYNQETYDRELKRQFDDDDKNKKDMEEIPALLASLGKVLVPILSQEFIFMANKKVWIDTNLLALWPHPDACPRKLIYADRSNYVKTYQKEIEGFSFTAPTLAECKETFSSARKNPYVASDGRLVYFFTDHNRGNYRRVTIDGWVKHVYPNFLPTCTLFDNYNEVCVFNTATHDRCNGSLYNVFSCDEVCYLLPIHRLSEEAARKRSPLEVLTCLIETGLIPRGLSEEEEHYQTLMRIWKRVKPYISVTGSDIRLDKKAYLKDAWDAFYQRAQQSEKISAYGETLLCECDWRRSNGTKYGHNYLTDMNRGHWDLAEEPEAGDAEVTLPENVTWYARPPQCDVKENGICAIDFGTKSTVVVFRDEKNQERLLRIGKEDLTAAPTEADYENPTVIEIRGFEDFMAAYQKREGRPFTCWEDMTVSHWANAAAGDDENYRVFNELKQWANDPERHINLSDKKNFVHALPPYKELADGDFDPIEIYAYYLGLYINNMVNGICLDYIMSFPVNYEKDVRERIAKSFEKGLRKSLPTSLLQDAEIMNNFRVQRGCSEPAAYAVTALHEFGLEPEEGEKVAYGVFDFGGGTTDFDFGIESIPEKKYHYRIEQFGFGGDAHLGGEHILAMMAYEVFKRNIKAMREKQIHIVLPYDGERFAGSEVLVKDPKAASKEALLNMRILSDYLRTIWERREGYEKLFEGEQSIELWSADGKKVSVPIDLDREKLDALVRGRIEKGVGNFFAKLKEAFRDQKYTTKIHIFLAGNASKSEIVQSLFREYIQKAEENVKTKTGKTGLYELHLPLASSAASDENREEADISRQKTGKTGVAFGLLRCRAGGKDVQIDNKNNDEVTEEVKCPYYFGSIDRKGKFKIDIGPKVGYGDWAEYTDASERDFELRYTKDARAQEGILTDSDVMTARCRLDADQVTEDESVSVYIRKKTPDTVEYVARRHQDGSSEFEIIGKIHEVKLH